MRGGKRVIKTFLFVDKTLKMECNNKLRSAERQLHSPSFMVFAYQFVCQNETSGQASVLLSQLATVPTQAQILLGPL